MARTPSMNTETCEAALGPRGSLIVTQANKAIVRKWATAKGLPGAYVWRLALPQLQGLYNVADDTRLAWHKSQATILGQTQDAPDDDREIGVSMTNDVLGAPINDDMVMSQDRGDVASIKPTAPSPAKDQVARISALLAELLAKPGIDADAVNALIDQRWQDDLPDMIAKWSPVTRVEVLRANGEVHEVEGHAHPKLSVLLKMMTSRQANGFVPNFMIVGPTGSGKTHAFMQACKAIGIEARTNGAISMDYQLIGYRDANGTYHETPFFQAFGRPCGYLFDEIDSSDNSPLLCLAGALANGGYSFPSGYVERHKDCIIAAAGNTWGLGAVGDFVGRNKLDAAILSRFPGRLYWDIDEALERNISGNIDWACRVQKARANVRRAAIKGISIDPRMTQAGAAYIASGFTSDEAAELTYLANLNPDQRKLVEAV